MGQPKAYGISRHIRDRILLDGEFQPGDKLPDTKELAWEYKTSHNTIATALAYLVGEGLIHRERFKGSWVTKKETA